MSNRALEDYYEVRESYFVGEELVSAGEIIHRKHPLFRAENCRPIEVRHDVEQMTAAPGEKRRTRVSAP